MSNQKLKVVCVRSASPRLPEPSGGVGALQGGNPFRPVWALAYAALADFTSQAQAPEVVAACLAEGVEATLDQAAAAWLRAACSWDPASFVASCPKGVWRAKDLKAELLRVALEGAVRRLVAGDADPDPRVEIEALKRVIAERPKMKSKPLTQNR